MDEVILQTLCGMIHHYPMVRYSRVLIERGRKRK